VIVTSSRVIAALSLFAALGELGAQVGVAPRPTLAVAPSQPAPGAVARLTLRAGADNPVADVRGTLSGEPLHFVRVAGGAWHALGGVPVDASRSVMARAEIRHTNGTVDSVQLVIAVPPPPRRRTEPLKVDTAFTAPPDPERIARIERENLRARQVGKSSHETPVMWTASFLRPRQSVITSMFGSGRVFNGELSARHLGVDFRGAIGDTVRAANRGIVAVVDSFVLAGNVIYIDHGAGVVTGYFHLSKQLVQPGDTVSRGQVIGLVGQSGRVTGPHLHWAARYGEVTVNPLDLVTISSSWYPASAAAKAARTRKDAARPGAPGTPRH